MKTMANLTAKQEQFIQEIVKGSSQRQAYKKVYSCKGWKDNSIDINASKMFAKAKVQLRYNELIAKHAEKAIITRQELLEGLRKAFYIALGAEPTKTLIKEIIDGEIKTIVNRISVNVDLKAVAAIAQQIAKLEGWQIDKLEHSGEISAVVRTTKKIEDYEELFRKGE
jgi:phage terminase small subunit